MRTLIASFKLFLFGLNCLWVSILQPVVMLITRGRASYILPQQFFILTCAIFRITVRTTGKPNHKLQSLFMGNHISYLDILVIGSVIRHSFVAKSEIEGWPLFGFLAKLQQTAYVVRKSTEAKRQAGELQTRLERGDSLIIFPEGTSTDATTVMPFKSSLFSLAYTIPDLHIQPISLKIISVDGKTPDTQDIRDQYAWHGDMDLEPHIWQFAKGHGATIALTFHDPIPANAYDNRKTLAKATFETVCNVL